LAAVDAKWVGFDAPVRLGFVAPLAATAGKCRQQLGPHRQIHHVWADGLEHAVHAAVQGVVVQRLPMRAVLCLGQLVMVEFKATVPSASIAATILEMRIQGHVIPKGQKGMEFTELASCPQRCG